MAYLCRFCTICAEYVSSPRRKRLDKHINIEEFKVLFLLNEINRDHQRIFQKYGFPPSGPFSILAHPLLLPSPIHDPTPVRLPLLQQNHTLPLRHITSINPATRLNAKPTPLPPSGRALNSRHLNILPRIKLESGLGGEDLEVNSRLGVVSRDMKGEGACGAGVEGHGSRVRVGDEAVVDVGVDGAEGEGFVGGDGGEGGGAGGWDAAGIDGEVGV